jgi:hypothetical protein
MWRSSTSWLAKTVCPMNTELTDETVLFLSFLGASSLRPRSQLAGNAKAQPVAARRGCRLLAEGSFSCKIGKKRYSDRCSTQHARSWLSRLAHAASFQTAVQLSFSSSSREYLLGDILSRGQKREWDNKLLTACLIGAIEHGLVVLHNKHGHRVAAAKVESGRRQPVEGSIAGK